MSLPVSMRSTLAAATVAATAVAALTGLAGSASAAPTPGPRTANAAKATTAAKAVNAALAPVNVGLYGSQDPTYDGVYRQALALLALTAAGQAPAPAAVTWLLSQQCADGGFEAFRADLTQPCAAPDSANFAGEDTNSTGLAAQALVALGKTTQASSAVAWLTAHQGADGGWSYYPDGAAGNDSDANSTSLSLSAFWATGAPAPTKNGLTPLDLLASLQVGCSGVVDERGAFTFFGSANDYATVQATLAMGSGFLPVAAASGADDAPTLLCPVKAKAPVSSTLSADYAAGYLVRRLAANGDVIPDPFNAGSTDFGSTANAVIALVATKHGASQVAATVAALSGQVEAYAHRSGADVPGALATLSLAASAAGVDPASFGGTNLTTRLAGTITVAAPSPSPSASPSASHTASHSAQPSDPSPSVSPARLAATGAGSGTGFSGLLAMALLGTGGVLVVGVRRRGAQPRHGHGS